ncbi:hypothetical protein [Pseudomonas kulmbachensis]|uniref:hypothetical protein n=1 Tax=Pseudomonas kulmbachensis TaxID=3043408 RepID=UPI002AB1DB12|nr:hypothetical protein [Pseudomonas sp. FLM 004-28]
MSIRSLAKNLPKDPDVSGNVMGWPVARNAPWSFIDIYAEKHVAQAEAKRLGAGHAVEFGSHKLGTNDFIGGSTPAK